MKKIKLKKLASALLAVVILSACGGITKMKDTASNVKHTVTPSPLEMHGGKVDITINTNFPGKYFNKKALLVLTPVLTYGDNEAAYDSIVFQGEQVEANYTAIPYEAGKTVTYSGSVPYVEAMKESKLMLKASALVKNKTIPFPPLKIADGVIATSALVQVDPKAILIGDKFERIIPEKYEADIHYVINQADVRSKELKADDIKELENKIATANSNKRVDIKNAAISAYASPDGPEDLNDKLSGKRGKSAEGYFTKLFKQSKVEKAKEGNFLSIVATPEDWDGFKTLMEKSDIKDKDLVLRVLSMHSDPVVREKEIKNIAEAFEEIKEKILPELRRSKLIVNVDNIGYSDKELLSLVKNNPDTLSLEEILYAAKLVEDIDGKLAAYQKASENFPKCFRAINNVGYAQVKKGNLEEAKAAFEKAKELNDNDVVNNNLGVIALLQGDKAGAEELFTSAMGAGDVVSYNLGIIKIIDGDYKSAVSYFGNGCNFNAALAKLLNGTNDEALSTLNCIDEPTAVDYYLKAIVGARTDNSDMVFSNLRLAVGQDEAIKSMVKTDLEFAKYRGDETFESIIQ